MESNMSLSVGFKGGQNVNGIIHRTKLPITLGGIISNDSANDDLTAYFGYAVSEKSDEISEFYIGLATGATFRGIIACDPAMLENQPAMPDYFLQGLPVTIVTYGPVWYMSWTKVATGAIDPVPGCIVITEDATGKIEFLAGTATSIPTGYSKICASVIAYDTDTNRALLFIGDDAAAETDVLSAECAMKSYSIVGDGINAIGNIVESTGAITVKVPVDTTVTSLIGNFILSDGATAKVSTTAQVSGVTSNDFTSPVTITVTAANGTTTKDYIVTVSEETASAECALKYYAIVATGATGFSAVGNIAESTGAVSVTVPAGTTVTALVGNFILSDGATAKVSTTDQVSGVTTNDFTSPVTFTVTAKDGTTTKEYTITVTVHS